MPYIGKTPEDTFRGLASYDTFTGDGSTTTFDVSENMPDGGQNDVTVVVDNVRQEPGASKSYTLGQDSQGRYRRVTFNTAPDSGAEIYVVNPGRSTQLNTISDNSITTAKIFADAVTSAKIADDSIDSEHIVDGSVDNVHLAGSIANAKLANSSITINGNAVSLGGSITAGTDWQAVVVADGSTQLNAVAGKGYFLDTNAGTIDVNLPTSPTRGDTVVIADYGNNFATNRVIINTGGKLIDSVVGGEPGSGGFTIETNGAVVELVFADNTAGWIIKQNNVPADLGAEDYSAYISATGGTVTTSGDFKIHTFTGDGCFVVSSLGNQCSSGSTVDYIVVAGGAGGGSATSAHAGGGGGAGGFRESKDSTLSSPHTASPLAATTGLTVATTTYPVTVGGGGAGSSAPTSKGTSGSNSVFSTITSTGGGGGGSEGGGTGAPIRPGNSGGSGGGGTSQTAGTGGSGNTPPTSPSQGFPGGTGTDTPPSLGNGGGGGATQAGQALQPSPFIQGAGGTGATTSISGTPTSYAGGGGGAGVSGAPSTTGGTGGTGGGGAGGPGTGGASPGTAGTVNTGGGGGGGAGASPPFGTSDGGSGGSGIVIIRYKFQ